MLCILTLTISNADRQDNGEQAAQHQGGPGKVNLSSVVKVYLAKDTPGFSVAYDYEFPGHQFIYIHGIGTVRSKGSFAYLTTDKSLEFRGSADGDLLLSVPLKETTVVASKPPLLPLANVEDFPQEFLPFTWDLSEPLQAHAQSVLAKYFHLASGAGCDKGVEQLRTTFTPLELKAAPQGVTAELALLLSFPCDAQRPTYQFQVRSLVMEGRTHSDTFRHTSDANLIQAGDDFVRALVAEMKAGGTVTQ
jgi:hypothetical protein